MSLTARKALAAAAVLLLASLACSALSSAPATGSTPAPSDQAVLLRDDFSSSDSGWGTGTDADSSIEYENGTLHMKVFKDNYFTWSNPDSATYQNVHIEVTAKNQAPDSRAGFGLLCNQQSEQDSSYYYFAVTTDGEYVIGKSAAGQDDLFLTNNDSWAASDKIARNAPSYRLAADCGPAKLTLYVDGKQVDSVTDGTYSKGGVGLFLWSGNDAAGEVIYDDFVMTQLK